MNIKAVIMDKVPETALNCPLFKGVWHEISPYTGMPVSLVDCSLYGHETYVKPFNHLLERCPFCPLITEEKYRAKHTAFVGRLIEISDWATIGMVISSSYSSSSGIRKLAEDRRSEFELLTKDWQERAK